MDDLVAAGGEQLGDQAPVTAPPERLGAHEARVGVGERGCERLLPFPRRHPRRVAAEGGDPDTAEALLPGLATATTAELDRVPVRDARLFEGSGERGLVELGMTARARETAHVRERPDARCAEQLQQLVDRPGSEPDGE